MSAEVYHKRSFRELMKDDRDWEGQHAMLQAQENAAWPKDYVHVATVKTGDRELAFQFTNSIERAWWENPQVIYNFEGEGCRSTSVGDVVSIEGKAFLCEGCGWSELE